MNTLVFRCDPARQTKQRNFALLLVACLLWSVVSYYLPWAAVGFVAVGWYLLRIRDLGDSRWIEVSISGQDFRVRRLGEDEWIHIETRPRIWGVWVVAPVPEHILPFGMLWLSEAMLGQRLFRQVRRVTREMA